jgi:hypothetical protein
MNTQIFLSAGLSFFLQMALLLIMVMVVLDCENMSVLNYKDMDLWCCLYRNINR